MRISKVTTRQGDKGETTLANGKKCSKANEMIALIGEVDELNAVVGMLKCALQPGSDIQKMLAKVQQKLFDLGAELSLDGYLAISDEDSIFLERQIADLNQNLPPLKEFVLPGTDRLNARAHLCRTVCRRVERSYVFCQNLALVSNPCALKWLNRLSDYFFVLARHFSQFSGQHEPMWQKSR